MSTLASAGLAFVCMITTVALLNLLGTGSIFRVSPRYGVGGMFSEALGSFVLYYWIFSCLI